MGIAGTDSGAVGGLAITDSGAVGGLKTPDFGVVVQGKVGICIVCCGDTVATGVGCGALSAAASFFADFMVTAPPVNEACLPQEVVNAPPNATSNTDTKQRCITASQKIFR